uniref:DUF4942 domain-containing protein n=1 Tax=Archaeoglobus fulgidus TaxID=2234 RepID=A0A7C2SK97_ARCFL
MKFDTYQLDLLNKLWERIEMIPELFKHFHEIIIEAFKLPEDSWTPFLYKFKLNDCITWIKEAMIRFVVNLMTEDMNLPIDRDDIVMRFRDKFDAFELVNYVEKEYFSRADELALEMIIRSVEDMIPSYLDLLSPEEKIAGILEKNRLVLFHYLEMPDPWEPVNRTEIINSIANIFKLAKIILASEPPSTVKAEEVYEAYRALHGDFFEKKEFGGPIVAVKVYKNGNIRFWFRNEKDAKEVARAIVYGLTEDTQTQSKLSEYLEKEGT